MGTSRPLLDAAATAGDERLAALGRMTAGVVHDVTNSLGAISLRLAALEAAIVDGDPRRADVAEIRHMAEACAERMRQVLKICRGSGERPEPLELRNALRVALPALRIAAGPGIDLVVRSHGGPCRVALTQAAIEHLLANLVRNAAQAMDGEGRVTITITRDGAWAELCVTDDGAGMDEAVLARAMEPFFTTRFADGGSGLGLAAVVDVAGWVGGDVGIDSAPGAGTTVVVRLPRS